MTPEQIEQYLKQEQEETEATLWGSTVKFKPYLLERVFGDGMKLIYFGTLDDRPYWWLVRVDSNANIDDPMEFNEEEIYEAIEEECGGFTFADDVVLDEDGYDKDGYCHDRSYPHICSDSSAHWGLVADLEKGIDRHGLPLTLKGGKK